MERLLAAQLISAAETFANVTNVSIIEFQLDESKKQVRLIINIINIIMCALRWKKFKNLGHENMKLRVRVMVLD